MTSSNQEHFEVGGAMVYDRLPPQQPLITGGADQNQRHLRGVLVHQRLGPELVVAKHVAVVAGESDDCVVQ